MLKLIPNPYVHERSISLQYVHTDSEELYNKNKQQLGPAWAWYNTPLSYNYNSYGYRMDKELSQVDSSNYIAFFGCSYTVGTGLPLECTYPSIIANTLKVDYVNAGLAGSSVDFAFMNIVELLDSTPPKAIIVQWPDITRTCYWEDNHITAMLVNQQSNSNWVESYKEFIMEETHMNNRFAFIRKTVKLLCKTMGIKLYELTIQQNDIAEYLKQHTGINYVPHAVNTLNYSENSIEYMNSYSARDLQTMGNRIISHPGIDCQNRIVNMVLEWYSK